MRTPHKSRNSKAKPATRRKKPRLPPAPMDVATQAGPYRLSAGPGSYTLSGLPAELRVDRATWAVERAAILERLDETEETLTELARIVEKTKRKRTRHKRQSKRGEIGDNNPPEAMDALPLDLPQITEGSDAIVVLRTEIESSAPPRWHAIRLCGFATRRLSKGVKLFLEAFISAAGKQSANAVFSKLQANLTGITEKIADWLHTVGLHF